MTLNRTDAAEKNKRMLDKGAITPMDIAYVTYLAQKFLNREVSAGLLEDGVLGPKTKAEAQGLAGTFDLPNRADVCWPMRSLPDGRAPVVTSGYKHHLRPNHLGWDIMYPVRPGDPVDVKPDGGDTKRFWVPKNGSASFAYTVAQGKVAMASRRPTGFRVWLQIAADLYVGYFHLDSLLVRVGEELGAGVAVGHIGDNPADTDPRHLHFELYGGDLDKYPAGNLDPAILIRNTTKVLSY